MRKVYSKRKFKIKFPFEYTNENKCIFVKYIKKILLLTLLWLKQKNVHLAKLYLLMIKVLSHFLFVHPEVFQDPGQLLKHIGKDHRRVGKNHSLDTRMADVSLVP